MNIRNHFTLVTLSLAALSVASAQTNSNKQLSPSYLESCIQNQVQQHQKLKAISPEDFRPYCECTSKQLLNNLNSSQLDELNNSNKRPPWLKPAEDSASKACLKPAPTTQV
ncbi:hypothetical protein [Polynucleobacter alcilacus]|uniref:hypothetical protein n=1 Tax=Polynucleobacter alcilacus TaxID=1819739 RepID=UPI001C0D7130|nr:hypothetical protein [Polynucleobacter alcilacus]MBU3567452.1 hypothetical protein [Polynucleobacter alcilacus]